jgi:hypothetical protein
MLFNEYSSASIPVDKEGKVYHLKLKSGDVSKYVLLPGDPRESLL